MEAIVKVKNLSKTFKNKHRTDTIAVKDVSFTLNKGETLGIVGESGSGKSTIAKLITGLIPQTKGQILISGRDITHSRIRAKEDIYSKIQMVFQNPVGSFNPRKTLGYGIGESLRNRGVPKSQVNERISELLTLCGLTPEFANRFPHEVSGGQCQRAAIARALAIEPEILICDEATSALDVTVQKQIIDLLIKLKKEKNLSIVFICHNLALVQMFCDRVLVLYEGEIVEQGVPDEVIFAPKAEYTKRLVNSIL